MPTIQELQGNPDYQKLSIAEQMVVASKVIGSQLDKDPNFLALTPEEQSRIRNNVVAQAPIVGRPTVDAEVHRIGGNWLNNLQTRVGSSEDTNAGIQAAGQDLTLGIVAPALIPGVITKALQPESPIMKLAKSIGTNVASSIEKGALQAGTQMMQSSGLAGLLTSIGDKVAYPEGNQPITAPEKVRMLDYFKGLEDYSGNHEAYDLIGKGLGIVADVVGVSKATAPMTDAITAGLDASKFALLHPRLAMLANQGLQSVVQAVPYLEMTDQINRQQGKESIWDAPPIEVAKTLGINAAQDFIVGSAMTAALGVVARGVKFAAAKGASFKESYTNAAEQATEIRSIRSGNVAPEMVAGLSPVTQDRVAQAAHIDSYINKSTAAAPDVFTVDRTFYLSNDLGKIIGKNVDTPGYHLWQFDSKGRATQALYPSFVDLENDLALDAYKAVKKLSPEDASKAFRQDDQWAIIRGETLFNQRAYLSNVDLTDADPALSKLWGQGKPVPATRRPILTKSEADKFVSTDTITVVQANIPITENIASNLGEGSSNLLKNAAPYTVTGAEDPNAIFIGLHQAPIDLYQKTIAELPAILKANPGLRQEDALAGAMLNKGYDHVKLPDGSVQFFSTQGMRLIGTPDDVLQVVTKPYNVGSASAQVIVNSSAPYAMKATEMVGNEDLLSRAAIKTLRSNDPQVYRNFSKAYLVGKGVDGPISVESTPLDHLYTTFSNGELKVFVPKSYGTYASEASSFSTYLSGLDDAAEKFGHTPSNTKAADYWLQKYNTLPDAASYDLPASVDPTSWFDVMSKKLGGSTVKTATGWDITTSAGKLSFTSADDVLSYLSPRVADPAFVRNDLAKQGIRVITTRAGFQARDYKTGKLLASGVDMPEIMGKLNYHPDKISTAYGPQVVGISPEGIDISFYGQTVKGSRKEAYKFLAKFEDPIHVQNQTLLKAANNGQLTQGKNGLYEVYLPRYDVYQTFDNPKDAQQFLMRQSLTFPELQTIADKKGLDLSLSNGDYVVRVDGTTTRVKTVDQLADTFRQYPDIEHSVPNILDEIDPSLETSVSDLVAAYKDTRPRAGQNKLGLPPNATPPIGNGISVRMAVTRNFSQTTGWIESAALKVKDPTLLQKWRTVDRGFLAARTASETDHKYIITAFEDSHGKLLSLESRARIMTFLGSDTPERAAGLEIQFEHRYGSKIRALNSEEQTAASAVRKFLDAKSVLYGISSDKLIYQYFPMLRDLNDPANAAVINELTCGEDLVAHHWQNKPPKELQFFAEHERTTDLLAYAMKDDPLEVLLTYASQGNKKFYMNDAWKDLDTYKKAANLDPAIMMELNHYAETVMGSNRTTGELAAANIGRKFFENIKKGPLGKLIPYSTVEMGDMGENSLSSIMGLTYVNSMGWRPWMGIRQELQPWSTTAPRLGVEWVAKGYKLADKATDETWQRLAKLGVISIKPPVINDIFSHQHAIGKVSEYAMRSVKNGDDYARAVSYLASEAKINNAIDAFKQGRLRTRSSWETLSGLDVMDPVLRDEAWTLVQKGDEQSFKTVAFNFAWKMTDESQFAQRASELPPINKGLLGRLYGQYGNFTNAYRANVARMFKYGSPAKRAEMVGTFLALNGALWAGFNALKINTNDYIPGAPGLFNGGPGFDIAVNILQGVGTDYKATQARSQAFKDITSTLVPGSTQYRYAKKALEYASQGDSYRMWLSLTGTPTIPDN